MVICTRGRSAELQQCLASVARLDYPALEVLVVDSGGESPETRSLAQASGAKYASEALPGLSRARNCAARVATTDLLAFLDDDAVPHPAWLRVAAPEFSDPSVMVVTGRSEVPASAASDVLQSVAHAPVGDERRVLDRNHERWFDLANFGGIGDGEHMVFRRAAFELWPGFDLRLGRGAPLPAHEEHLAFHDLIAAGYRVVYAPEASVLHPVGNVARDFSRRSRDDMVWSAAYMTLLFVERPAFRLSALRYALGALAGRPRAWRKGPAIRSPLSPWRRLLAWLKGPVFYLRMRLQTARQESTA